MNLKNMILDKEIIDTNRDIVKADLHITLGIDENFAMGMGVLITSVLENNKENIGFHIFTDKLSSETKEKLSELARKYNNASIVIYNIDYEQLKRLPTYFIWTTAMYYRFLVPIELNKLGIKYCWYLDSDELCIAKIDNKLKIEEDKAFAAVEYAIPSEDLSRLQRLLGKEKFSIFYSAGLFINVKAWCDLQLSEKAIQGLIDEGDEYRLPDADALLKAVGENWMTMPDRYNYVYNMVLRRDPFPDDVVFVHYTATAKPWQIWAQDNPQVKYWIKYKEISPWKFDALQSPGNRRQARFMIKHMKRKNDTLGILKWYFKYLSFKIVGK